MRGQDEQQLGVFRYVSPLGNESLTTIRFASYVSWLMRPCAS
jgi:hypothetical protein